MFVDGAVLATALAAVRFFGPATLLLIVLSLSTLKPEKVVASPSPIVDITTRVTTPRRTLIFTILSIASLTYLLDGVVVVLRAVLWKTWEGWDKNWTGIEVSDVLGLVAFGLAIVLGVWKDAQGAPVWTSKRMKVFAAVGLLYAATEVGLLGAVVSQGKLPQYHAR